MDRTLLIDSTQWEEYRNSHSYRRINLTTDSPTKYPCIADHTTCLNPNGRSYIAFTFFDLDDARLLASVSQDTIACESNYFDTLNNYYGVAPRCYDVTND